MKLSFKNLIQEILSEMFIESLNLNEIKPGSKIVILFQDNKVEIEKIKNKFKVLKVSNPERIKPNDILEFIEFNITTGASPRCYIYRKNKIGKYKKIKMIHDFSYVKSVEII